MGRSPHTVFTVVPGGTVARHGRQARLLAVVATVTLQALALLVDAHLRVVFALRTLPEVSAGLGWTVVTGDAGVSSVSIHTVVAWK